MAIFVDQPIWSAHNTLWSHLISDQNFDELHVFAERLGVPRRSFDLDHYDIPQSLFIPAQKLGAKLVSSREIVLKLKTSGLRVVGHARDATREIRRTEFLKHEWLKLHNHIADNISDTDLWRTVGNEVLARWNEPHRSYHNIHHLEDVLLALNHLEVRGAKILPETLLAAWFHDVIYEGKNSLDELASAQFAYKTLTKLGVHESLSSRVSDYIVRTIPGAVLEKTPEPLKHLLDSDLSIFAAPSTRYQEYTEAVRLEYAHVPDPVFINGRREILTTYLSKPQIYYSTHAKELWESRARTNLLQEIRQLSQVNTYPSIR